jgi:uncharacterized membrane protein YqaE (UPF0057 family)
MKFFTKILFASTLVLTVASCSSSNEVVSNRLIQKRKYTNGFHLNNTATLKNSSNENESENKVAYQATSTAYNENSMITDQTSSPAHTNISDNVDYSDEITIGDAIVEVNRVNTVSSEEENIIQQNKTINSNKKLSAKKTIIKQFKQELRESKGNSLDPIVYILLAIFIPFVAVGLATDWEVKDVVINLLLCFLCGIPGIIHAFIVCKREGVI